MDKTSQFYKKVDKDLDLYVIVLCTLGTNRRNGCEMDNLRQDERRKIQLDGWC